MSFSDSEKSEIEDTAELSVRRYFDHYLEEVFPQAVKAMISQHNTSSKAHGGVQLKFSKLAWMIAGASMLGGGTWAGISKLFGH